MNMVDESLEEPFTEGDKVPMLKNLIKHTEEEIVKVEADLKKLVMLKKEIAALKENIGE